MCWKPIDQHKTVGINRVVFPWRGERETHRSRNKGLLTQNSGVARFDFLWYPVNKTSEIDSSSTGAHVVRRDGRSYVLDRNVSVMEWHGGGLCLLQKLETAASKQNNCLPQDRMGRLILSWRRTPGHKWRQRCHFSHTGLSGPGAMSSDRFSGIATLKSEFGFNLNSNEKNVSLGGNRSP